MHGRASLNSFIVLDVSGPRVFIHRLMSGFHATISFALRIGCVLLTDWSSPLLSQTLSVSPARADCLEMSLLRSSVNGKTVSCVPHATLYFLADFVSTAVYFLALPGAGTYLQVALLYLTHFPDVSAV